MVIGDLLITTANNQRFNLPTHRAYNITISQTKHGYGLLQFTMRLTFAQIALLYGNPQAFNVTFTRAKRIFDGRLEDIELSGNIVKFTAFGYWRALDDLKYTALWSTTAINDWFILTKEYNAAVLANRTPEKYQIDFDNRINVALTKGTAYANAADLATIAFAVPHNSVRPCVGIAYTLEMLLPNNWRFTLASIDNAYTGASSALITTIISAGVLRVESAVIYFPLQINTNLLIDIFNTTGGVYNMAGETGTFYAKLTDVRVVTEGATRWINTTLTAARAAGVNVTATVVTTANMYVGQLLTMNSGLPGVSEVVTVLSIGSATQFNATFTLNHANGSQVSALAIYGDQIVADLYTKARTLNTGQLSTSQALIQQSNFDLLNEVYTEAQPSEIIDYLCGLGDGTQRYEAGIKTDKTLYYRPRSNQARQWYIDYGDPQVKTSIDQLFNSVYTLYRDRLKGDLRTATATDAISIGKYGITRQTNSELSNANPNLAIINRDLTLTNLKTITPQATIKVPQIFSLPNTIGQLTDLDVGDYVTVLNMPAVVTGTALDKLRTFRVVETSLDVSSALLSITPELTLPTVDYQLANLLQFVNRLPSGKFSTSTNTKNMTKRQT